ncbi:MAG: hypothetical protein DWQ19_08770 [Crenarchaeota archaeon]|nr:MAG: hypothetical protein DWQ19_08770 [Thermoproteota archaeon]
MTRKTTKCRITGYKFTTQTVKMPENDCDVILQFPSGKEVLIQARPTNAEEDYDGSLDIILPEDMPVINWQGDDMEPAEITEIP